MRYGYVSVSLREISPWLSVGLCGCGGYFGGVGSALGLRLRQMPRLM
jgi:hypothetical protein